MVADTHTEVILRLQNPLLSAGSQATQLPKPEAINTERSHLSNPTTQTLDPQLQDHKTED